RVFLVRSVLQTPEKLGRDEVRAAPPALLPEDVAHDRLGPALGIYLGVIEEINPGCVRGRHTIAGEIVSHLIAVGDPGAERELADFESRGAQAAVIHSDCFS